MLNPMGSAPVAFGSDSRYGQRRRQQAGGGKLRLYTKYAPAGAQGARPGLEASSTCSPPTGAATAPGTSTPSRRRRSPAPPRRSPTTSSMPSPRHFAPTSGFIVVYSAGGGGNVAAEAVGYLLEPGYSKATLVQHFAVVQHGNNWVTNYEAAARILTRDFTVAISNQNYDTYGNGMNGPGLQYASGGPRPPRPPSAPPSTRRWRWRPAANTFENLTARASLQEDPRRLRRRLPRLRRRHAAGSSPRSATGCREPRRCRTGSTGPT